MEELPGKTSSAHKLWERRELLRSSSSSSSLSSHAPFVLHSSSFNSISNKTVVETRHLSWMKGTELQKTSTHILAAAQGTHCEKHAPAKNDTELKEDSASLIERADDAEHATPLDGSAHTFTPPHKVGNTEHVFRQKDAESQQTFSDVSTLLESANDTEHASPHKDTDLLEIPTQISSPSEKTNETDQTLGIDVELQEMSAHANAISTYALHGQADCAQQASQQKGSEIQEISTCIPTLSERTEVSGELTMQSKHTQSQDTPTQISRAVIKTDDVEHIWDDVEHASQMKNMDSQKTSTSISTLSENSGDAHASSGKRNTELQEASMHATMIELSLHQHLQQNEVGKEEAAMWSFIMNRFLPAAKEVAAEHESSVTCRPSKDQAIAQAPQQSQRPPIAHRIKSKAHQAPKVFASCSKQQEDSVPYSMKSCGLFCLGLKSALFRAHRSVPASRSTSRQKGWAPRLSNRVKTANHGTSFISSEEGAVASKMKATRGDMWKQQGSMHICASVSHSLSSPTSVIVQESSQRRAMKYQDSFSREPPEACTSPSEYVSVACTPHYGQSGNGDQAGRQSENMESMHSDHCHHGGANCIVLEPDRETVWEVVERIPLQDLACENNVSCSPLQNHTDGMKAKGSPADHYSFESAQQDQDNNNDNESQFYDTLSRLNSIQSNATFYTFGSPRSQCEVPGYQGEWINDEAGFIDASSHFETPRTSTSEDTSVLSHTCVENEKCRSGKMSNLSQRVGKVLKLETRVEQTSVQSKHNPSCDTSHEQHESAYFVMNREPQPAEFRSESFSRLWHPSLDSISGLCLSNASTVSPIFPAKCSTNALGWPFGISTYQSSRESMSPDNGQQKKSIEKYVTGLNVPSPPLPPSPTGSWLGKAITKNATKTSPLASLQQKQRVVLARKKLDFVATNTDGESRWEDVVKGSQVQLGHLRFSEDLHKHHPSNLNAIKPLKL